MDKNGRGKTLKPKLSIAMVLEKKSLDPCKAIWIPFTWKFAKWNICIEVELVLYHPRESGTSQSEYFDSQLHGELLGQCLLHLMFEWWTQDLKQSICKIIYDYVSFMGGSYFFYIAENNFSNL